MVSDSSSENGTYSSSSSDSSDSDNDSIEGEGGGDERHIALCLGADVPVIAPPFVGEVLRVHCASVFGFHDEAFTKLAALLHPHAALTRERGAVALSICSKGIVTMRVLVAGESFFSRSCAQDEMTVYAVDPETGSLVGCSSRVPKSNRTLPGSVATTWSAGFPVYWALSTKAQFFPSTDMPEMAFLCNHDHELYDLPDKYLGILRKSAGKFSKLECEAFACLVMHGTRKKRPSGIVDRISMYPPRPTRPLQRATDMGRSRSGVSDTVDHRSSKRFTISILDAYAARSKTGRRWLQPPFDGDWDETRGKLVWLLLSLDEDDLHHCISQLPTFGCEFELFERQIVMLLLQAPWFVTTNAVDARLGVCVPLGATVSGENQWFDQSLGKWKSRLGHKAFQGVHTHNYEKHCDRRCCLEKLVRAAHSTDARSHVHVDTIEYNDYDLMVCCGCGKEHKDVKKELMRDVEGSLSAVLPVCTSKACSQLEVKHMFCNQGLRREAKCTIQGCKTSWVTCDCSSGDKLARKQRDLTEETVSNLDQDLDEIALRVRQSKSLTLFIGPKRPTWSSKRYTEWQVECVDEIVDVLEDRPHALVIRCQAATRDSPPGTFDDSELEEGSYDRTALLNAKLVEDAYTAMAMNARWKAVAFTRDSIIVEFDASAASMCQDCAFCMTGVCERWDDGTYNCVTCKRGKQQQCIKSVFPYASVADVNVMAKDSTSSYSRAGVDIDNDSFYEIFLRNMAQRFF
jgi:hypothetical protein